MITINEEPKPKPPIKFKQGDIIQHKHMRGYIFLLGQEHQGKFQYVILHGPDYDSPRIGDGRGQFNPDTYSLFEGTITLENTP